MNMAESESAPERREGTCEICHRAYPVWFAPNDLWNEHIRADGSDKWQFLCPTCFANVVAGKNRLPPIFQVQTADHLRRQTERADELAEALREVSGALNNLLPLWITEHGQDWWAVDESFDALATARELIPDLPITASYVDEVYARQALAKQEGADG